MATNENPINIDKIFPMVPDANILVRSKQINIQSLTKDLKPFVIQQSHVEVSVRLPKIHSQNGQIGAQLSVNFVR